MHLQIVFDCRDVIKIWGQLWSQEQPYMKFWASRPQIYGFQQAKPIRILAKNLHTNFMYFCQKSCPQLGTGRLLGKCKPERTILNCDMAYWTPWAFSGKKEEEKTRLGCIIVFTLGLHVRNFNMMTDSSHQAHTSVLVSKYGILSLTYKKPRHRIVG